MANNWQLGMIAGLDGTQSRNQLNTDIKGLARNLDKLKLYTEIDKNQVTQLQHQLKKLQVQLNNVTVSDSVINELVAKINAGLQNVNIGNINVGNIGNQAQQIGQYIGQQINQGVQQEINNNERILSSFRNSLQRINSSDTRINMDTTQIETIANDIENLNLRLNSLKESMSNTRGRRGDRNILSVDVSGIDQLGQAVTLTRQYNVDTGELIRNVDAVSTAAQRANTQLENLSAQQIKRQQDLRNQISQIYNSAIDPNASRSITNNANLTQLRTQYNAIQTAINEMGGTSKTVFAEQEANVTSLITTLKNSVSEYKNAENVSTSLKPDKLAEGISKAQSRWKALNADIQNSGASSEKLTQEINTITSALSRVDGGGILSKAEVERVHTALTNAKNELTALVKIDTSNSSLEAIRLQADTLKNKLDEFSKKNTGFADWTREVNGVTVSVETLKTELDGVRTASDLRVATARVNEFESAFKAVNATASKTNVDKLNADVQTLTNNLNTFASKNAGFNTFKTDINGVEVSLDSLIQKLSTVDNNTDLSTIRSQADALKTAFSQIQDVNKIQLLSNGGIKNDYATQIAKLEGDFRSLGLAQDTINTKTQNVKNALTTLRAEFAKPLDQQNFQAIETANNNLQRELIESRNEFEQLRASMKGMATEQQRLSLANAIEAWNQKNTAATKTVREENERYVVTLRDLSNQMTKMDFNKINTGFKQNENSMRALNRLGASVKDQFTQAYQSFTMWLSASTMAMKVISETREAFTELKEINTILTEISKANESLTKADLENIGDNSFDIASNYGKSATDYLSGVQEASRAGYTNAEEIAELSTAIQGAGDVTADIANKYVIATDKAYGLKGSVEELTKVFDGTNKITNLNAVNMSELAEAMTIVGSTAASFGVEVDETTAAIATMSAVTQQSGSEVARAFKAILLNIRQVSDEEEGIDAEGLTKYEKACNALGVSLKETRNGVLETRDAMDVLKELSEEYVKLDENDLRRTELLNSVGGKSLPRYIEIYN